MKKFFLVFCTLVTLYVNRSLPRSLKFYPNIDKFRRNEDIITEII